MKPLYLSLLLLFFIVSTATAQDTLVPKAIPDSSTPNINLSDTVVLTPPRPDILPVVVHDNVVPMKSSKWKFDPYLFMDFYYSYDFNKPEEHTKPYFYNHNKHNQFALNAAVLGGRLSWNNRIRAGLAFMAGTYVVANVSSEPVPLRYIYEATIGVRLAKGLWIDAGIFPSHISWEGVNSKDQWVLTRSIMAENIPYYLTGVKATWQINDKWMLLVVGCQGWQNMRETAGNTNKAVGTQLTFAPSKKVSLNYSTFFGNEKTDAAKQYRFLNDVFGTFQLTDKLGMIAGFDLCMEQKAAGSTGYNFIYAPIVIMKYAISDRFAIGARGEYYSDGGSIMVPTGTKHGFKVGGASLNFDYNPFDFASIRLEARMLKTRDDNFVREGKATAWDAFVTASLAVSF